jgi:uncharacterized protein YbjT (DUF2867 family)
MKVAIFGASGMVGAGVLLECVEDPRVEAILVVGRSSCGVTHPKLREILHRDFFDYGPIQSELADRDACFFCLGVSSVGMSEELYRHLTYDLTIAAATAMVSVNSQLTLCYVSGAGTDSTERGRVRWARVKGKTENALLGMPFKAAFMFRPAFIQPLKGVRSKTAWYQAVYTAIGALYPLLRRLPRYVTTTENMGRAMIQAAAAGYPKRILESDDINRLAVRQ